MTPAVPGLKNISTMRWYASVSLDFGAKQSKLRLKTLRQISDPLIIVGESELTNLAMKQNEPALSEEEAAKLAADFRDALMDEHE